MTKNTEEGPVEGTEILYAPKDAQPMRGYVLGTTPLGRVTIAREVGRWNGKDEGWIIDHVWPSEIKAAGRSSVTAVPLSPEMVEKLINLIYTWMVDSAAEETGVTMEQFMTEIKSTPRVIKADSDLRTRLLGIR